MDPRYIQLAQQLVRYSTALKRGEKILLDLVDTPEDMAVALVREVRLRKGIPFLRLGSNRLSREMLMGATDDQYQATSKHLLSEMKDMDAYIAIRGSHNITETSDVPAKKMGTAMKYLRKVLDHRVKKTKWCVLRWPHPAMAQQAGMSTAALENFDFDALQDDGSCEFILQSPCPTDLNQDGATTTADLLEFLISFGDDCTE